MARIKTFAFMDLETTGLPWKENYQTKVTEITIITVHSEHLRDGVIPRVQNKLSICVNPNRLISVGSKDMTGLSNLILDHLAPFTKTTVQMINNFLEHSPKPICLVAHNGISFDYPILRTEIENTGQRLLEGVLCIDSLQAFKQIDAQILFSESIPQEVTAETQSPDTLDSIAMEFQDGFNEMLCQALDTFETDGGPKKKGLKRTLKKQKIEESSNGKKLKAENSKFNLNKSYKLVDVYERLTNKKAVDAHQAENDVLMLVTCAATLGEKFVDWANENFRSFADIPKMMPRKKSWSFGKRPSW